jgi:hypothetical protein
MEVNSESTSIFIVYGVPSWWCGKRLVVAGGKMASDETSTESLSTSNEYLSLSVIRRETTSAMVWYDDKY